MPLSIEQKQELCNRIKALPKEKLEQLAESIVLPRMTTGHQISVINTLLLHWQGCANPTIIGGFNQWREIGRTVSEGQTAVYIRRPITREDPNKEKGEESSGDKTFFIFIPVFELQQTEEYNGKAPATRSQVDGNSSPRVITAKFRSACHGCKGQIRKGDKINYDRSQKQVLCMNCKPQAALPQREDAWIDEQYDKGAFYGEPDRY